MLTSDKINDFNEFNSKEEIWDVNFNWFCFICLSSISKTIDNAQYLLYVFSIKGILKTRKS